MNFLTQVPWVKPVASFFGVIIAMILIGLSFNALSKRRGEKRKAVIADFEFPAGVAQRVKGRYPHLNDVEIELALQQLRLYFLLCLTLDSNELALPSRVVDVCWHSFILETKSYQRFCTRAFGRFLHHTPYISNADSRTDALVDETDSVKISLKDGARVYQAALSMVDIVSSSINPVSSSVQVPMLFAIDQLLKIPDGYIYSDEVLHLLAIFDWQKSQLSESGSQSPSDSNNASLDCGDGSGSCGSCGGGH